MIILPCPACKAEIKINPAYIDPTKESIIEKCTSCNKAGMFKKTQYKDALDNFLKTKNPQNKQNTPPQNNNDKTNIAGGFTSDKTNIAGGFTNQNTMIDAKIIDPNQTEIITKNIVFWETIKLVDMTNAKTYFLQKGQNTIGKNAGVSIKTDDQYMSGQHCCIEVKNSPDKGTDVILYDNGTGSQKNKESTNGTFWNESQKRMSISEKIYLKSGDKIRMGRTDFIIRME